MPAQRSAGAIIFRREEGTVYYLLLQYSPTYWGMAKGGIEKYEQVEETASREIREETGLTDIHFTDDFKVEIEYFFKRASQRNYKTVTFLLAETHEKDVKISFEHIGYVWLPFEESLQKVTYQNEKNLLHKAREYIESH